jgi:rare lipoprotein A
MVIDQHLWRGLRGAILVVMAAMVVTACSTPKPRLDIGRPIASSPRGPMVSPSGKPLRGTEKPYQIKGIWYYPHPDPDYDIKGVGSWYGEQFHNRRTANGEIFDMDLPSAAHKTLPLPSLVEVTNLDNGRKMVVRVNDRGPFVGDRVIDLSKAAADQLGYRRQGVARVRVRYVGPAPKNAFDTRQYVQAPSAPVAPAPKPASTRLAFRDDEPIVWPAEPPPVRTQVIPSRPEPKPVEIRTPSAPPAIERAEIVPTRASTFRVQAGSFSNRENAERAVAQLKTAGWATIEPMERASGTLYRVTVSAGADEGEAWSMRDRVIALGYSDATVLRP